MKVATRTTMKKKQRAVLFLVALFGIGVLGVWSVQIRAMLSNRTGTDVAQTVEFTKDQIEQGEAFAQSLIDVSAFEAVPDLVLQFQQLAQEELVKQQLLEEAAAAMIEELETNEALYAEEEPTQ